jgi:hypothetical protein
MTQEELIMVKADWEEMKQRSAISPQDREWTDEEMSKIWNDFL